MSLFIGTLTDENGEEYEYGHCYRDHDDGSVTGCGMEFAWYPEREYLERWHDAVGLVSTFESWDPESRDWLEEQHARHHTNEWREEA